MASLMERLKQLKRIMMEKEETALPEKKTPKKKEKVYTEDAVDKVKSRRQQEMDILKDL